MRSSSGPTWCEQALTERRANLARSAAIGARALGGEEHRVCQSRPNCKGDQSWAQHHVSVVVVPRRWSVYVV